MRVQALFVALLFALPTFGQTQFLVPADNLVIEGIPAIPASITEDVRRYTESRGASLSSWHPVKREMLIGTRFGDTNQVHLVKLPGGARTQLTFFSERAGGASFRPKTGEYFIFNRDVGGNEFFQFYRFDVATGEMTLITDGKSRNTGGSWSQNGEWLAYSSTRRSGKDTDIYIVNPADPTTTRMLMQVEGGGWAAGDWSPELAIGLQAIKSSSLGNSYQPTRLTRGCSMSQLVRKLFSHRKVARKSLTAAADSARMERAFM